MATKIVAFIDIGTNSIRLLLERINKSYSRISEQKEVIRLGEDEFTDGYLRETAMERAALICKEFVRMAEANEANEIVAVATSATREAKNKNSFIQLLRNETGIDVRPISGLEEARLIYMGIAYGNDLKGQTALMIDIGGGSTEVIIGDQEKYLHLESLKLGAIRQTTQLLGDKADKPISKQSYARIQEYIRNYTVRAIQRLKSFEFDTVYGSSGTIKTLADIGFQNWPNDQMEGSVVTFEQVERAIHTLRKMPADERAIFPGMNPKRADIIIPGAAIIHTLMEELNIQEVNISETALREGMLFDYIRDMDKDGIIHEASVQMRTVMHLVHKYNVDLEHAEKVSQLAQALFDSAKEIGLHRYGEAEKDLLNYAALLHDVGIFLSYSDHQEHSYYLIMNSDLIGFDQNETNVIASTAYFHRKRFPTVKHEPFAELDAYSQGVVLTLAILLRVAESLDRGHKGSVNHIKLLPKGENAVELEIHCNEDCQLEVWGLKNHVKAFKRAFGRRLDISIHRK